MGQTLTHGIYLPDEGERNCYSGLAANWQLLDGAVGTVAEHTTQIAGKAPLVHTHTKRNVTDLLNSNFIPSATNSYDLGSSSYQWNNLYASKIRQINSFSSYADVYQVLDSSNNRIVSFRITKEANRNTLGINVHDQNNSAPKGLVIENDLSNNITITGGGINNYLGTSTNKWKTLNGVNPGALSLPDLDNTYRWSLDTTNWLLDGSSNNTFTPNFSGWINIRIPDAAGNYIIMQSGSITVSNQGTGALASTITRPLSLLIPVIEGVSGLIRVKAASIVGFFYPALGNPIKTIQPSS